MTIEKSNKLKKRFEEGVVKNPEKKFKFLDKMGLNPLFEEKVREMFKKINVSVSELVEVTPIIKEENDKLSKGHWNIEIERQSKFDSGLVMASIDGKNLESEAIADDYYDEKLANS